MSTQGGTMKTAESIIQAVSEDLDAVIGRSSILRCSVCKRWEWTGKSGGYLAHGWPTCCKGFTMTLVTQRQLDEEGWEPESF
jgi:hypothetical protein